MIDLNVDNRFVYLATCEDYNAPCEDAILKFIILAETIEAAIKAAHTVMKQCSYYRINGIEFIGSVGIYGADNERTPRSLPHE